MKTQMITTSKRLLILGILTFGFLTQPYAQFSKMLLEKAIKTKANTSKVEASGDEGKVYVYKTAERKEKITNITGLTKLYCRAYIHEKSAKKMTSSYYVDYRLWRGSDCSLNGGTDCKDFGHKCGDEKIAEKNQMTGQAKLLTKVLDFEIDMVETTEWEIKNNQLGEGTSFYVVLDFKKRMFLAVSDQLTFDLKASAATYGEATVNENKDLKLKTAAFKDAQLETAVRNLFLQRGVTEVKDVRFYTGWTIERDNNNKGNIVRRYCKVNISCKEDGQCKYYWARVWEEYLGGGKYELPSDKNESFNHLNSQLVPCENL